MKYELKRNSDGSFDLICNGKTSLGLMPSDPEVQFWLQIEQFTEENKQLREENNELREVIATTCDLVNNWAREEGVNECRFPSGVRFQSNM